jgi:hypothetical protein
MHRTQGDGIHGRIVGGVLHTEPHLYDFHCALQAAPRKLREAAAA